MEKHENDRSMKLKMKPEQILKNYVSHLSATSGQADKQKDMNSKTDSRFMPKSSGLHDFLSSNAVKGRVRCTFSSLCTGQKRKLQPTIGYLRSILHKDRLIPSNHDKDEAIMTVLTSLSDPSNADEFHSCARTIEYDAHSNDVELAPFVLLQNASDSLAKAVDARLKAYALLLLARNVGKRDPSALEKIDKFQRETDESNIFSAPSCVKLISGASSFAHVPDVPPLTKITFYRDEEGGPIHSSVRVSMALTFAAVMVVEVRNCGVDSLLVELHAPGEITGFFTGKDERLLQSVETSVDANALLRSMSDQSKMVVMQSVASSLSPTPTLTRSGSIPIQAGESTKNNNTSYSRNKKRTYDQGPQTPGDKQDHQENYSKKPKGGSGGCGSDAEYVRWMQGRKEFKGNPPSMMQGGCVGGGFGGGGGGDAEYLRTQSSRRSRRVSMEQHGFNKVQARSRNSVIIFPSNLPKI